MQIAAYVRISTDDQNEQRQVGAIREKYAGSEQDNRID
jgi:DNA invertase Pin-like site-specific DNA recombinase